MAGINDKTFFGDDVTLVGSGAGAQDVIQITPDTAIGGVAWKGGDIDGSALDPTTTGATITGWDIDLSGVSLANDPIMDGLLVQLPATFSGVEEKHCVRIEGFGSTIKICDGDDDRALSLDNRIHVDFDASGLAAGEVTAVLDQDIAIGAATDGHVHCLDVTSIGSGSVEVVALSTNSNVDVIHQHVGTFGAIDQGWIELGAGGFTDSTAAFNGAGADLAIFVSNTDLIYIGMTASFDQIEVILDTVSSKDLRPDFAYSTGAGFTDFVPDDGTNGFQENGVIKWISADLAGFAARIVNGSANLFFIRITRDRAGALTNPIEDTIQALAATEFGWDATGDVEINSALVGISNSGSTNTIKLQNPSDTGNSSSQIEASVGGTSAGDPWVQWTIGTARSFALGIDNTDSDFLKLTHDSDATVDPSSGTVIMTVDPALDHVGFFANPLGAGLADVAVIKGTVGSQVAIAVNNNDNTNVLSHAVFSAQVGGVNGGNAYYNAGGGGSNVSWGTDNADNAFKMAHAPSLESSATYFMVGTPAGEVTFPLTPAFLAIADGSQTDIPINANTTLQFPTEITDQNADYNNGTYTFTAPVVGNYQLSYVLQLAQVDATTTSINFQLNTSNRSYTYRFTPNIQLSADGGVSASVSILADMDAADTVTLSAQINNTGAPQMDLLVGSSFSGYLAC